MSMKSTIKAASDKVAEVFSAKPDKAGDMDILDKLQVVLQGTPPPWLRKALAKDQPKVHDFEDDENEELKS